MTVGLIFLALVLLLVHFDSYRYFSVVSLFVNICYLNPYQLHIQYGDQSLGLVTVSLGVSAFPNHGDNPRELLQNADLALYKAKEEGRDRVISADLLPQ